MLAVKRKRGQEVWIGTTRVQIVGVDRGEVLLGVDCQEDMEVLRAETIQDRPIPNPKYRVTVPRPAPPLGLGEIPGKRKQEG